MPTVGDDGISLYFHIPFCTSKCPYCHFYVIPNKLAFHQVLLEGLKIEWASKLPLILRKRVVSIYFGGGTPTLFAPDGISAILNLIKESGVHLAVHCEITIEANPEDGNLKLFEELRQAGVNRLSFGIQSLDDRSLQVLERIHSAKKGKEAIFQAAQSGFQNISIDLMYDLPDQTEASFSYTLDQLKQLPIQHLSLYNLTIEPHTSFYKRRKELKLPSSETSLRFLQRAVEAIEQQGLRRYEISAFAKLGYESRHNTGYWTARPFLGLGPSAFSYWDGARFSNLSNLQRYTRNLKEGLSPVAFSETLDPTSQIKEKIAVELRLIKGIDLKRFTLPEETKSALEKLRSQGLLKIEGLSAFLTEKGRLFYDTVASEII
jgi:oxygen-independent coproporphyrinogen-3 oxidase